MGMFQRTEVCSCGLLLRAQTSAVTPGRTRRSSRPWLTDSDSLWFEKCEDEGWEKDFTFNKEPTAPSHGAGILGQVKSSDGRCFGVDGWVKPVMTSCDSDTTGETGLPVENSWYLIEHDRRN